MDDAIQEARMAALYPSMIPKPPSTAVPTPEKIAVDAARAEGTPILKMSQDVVGVAWYGHDPGEGQAAGDYSAHGVSDLYGELERESRLIHDDEGVALVRKSAEAANAALVDYEVGISRSKEIMLLARKYSKSETAPASIEQVNYNLEKKLRSEYGSQTDKLLDGARKVTADLMRRIPGFSDIVNKGLGSDETFVRAMINAARKKGWA